MLHWDGKVLPDITGGPMSMERTTVIVTGGEHEKLLGLPAQAERKNPVPASNALTTGTFGRKFDTTHIALATIFP